MTNFDLRRLIGCLLAIPCLCSAVTKEEVRASDVICLGRVVSAETAPDVFTSSTKPSHRLALTRLRIRVEALYKGDLSGEREIVVVIPTIEAKEALSEARHRWPERFPQPPADFAPLPGAPLVVDRNASFTPEALSGVDALWPLQRAKAGRFYYGRADYLAARESDPGRAVETWSSSGAEYALTSNDVPGLDLFSGSTAVGVNGEKLPWTDALDLYRKEYEANSQVPVRSRCLRVLKELSPYGEDPDRLWLGSFDVGLSSRAEQDAWFRRHFLVSSATETPADRLNRLVLCQNWGVEGLDTDVENLLLSVGPSALHLPIARPLSEGTLLRLAESSDPRNAVFGFNGLGEKKGAFERTKQVAAGQLGHDFDLDRSILECLASQSGDSSYSPFDPETGGLRKDLPQHVLQVQQRLRTRNKASN